ncbi:MAG: hypothetical protein CMM07_29115 [Rhodopirellula sp.]|nr:hypothetical protein [Rhodopirellula sp.]
MTVVLVNHRQVRQLAIAPFNFIVDSRDVCFVVLVHAVNAVFGLELDDQRVVFNQANQACILEHFIFLSVVQKSRVDHRLVPQMPRQRISGVVEIMSVFGKQHVARSDHGPVKVDVPLCVLDVGVDVGPNPEQRPVFQFHVVLVLAQIVHVEGQPNAEHHNHKFNGVFDKELVHRVKI